MHEAIDILYRHTIINFCVGKTKIPSNFLVGDFIRGIGRNFWVLPKFLFILSPSQRAAGGCSPPKSTPSDSRSGPLLMRKFSVLNTQKMITSKSDLGEGRYCKRYRRGMGKGSGYYKRYWVPRSHHVRVIPTSLTTWYDDEMNALFPTHVALRKIHQILSKSTMYTVWLC